MDERTDRHQTMIVHNSLPGAKNFTIGNCFPICTVQYSVVLYRVIYSIPFPNKPLFLYVCSRNLLKILWEKEKLLAMSNFSFSHSVFYMLGELSAIFKQKLKLSSATSFSVEEFKICHLGQSKPIITQCRILTH